MAPKTERKTLSEKNINYFKCLVIFHVSSLKLFKLYITINKNVRWPQHCFCFHCINYDVARFVEVRRFPLNGLMGSIYGSVL